MNLAVVRQALQVLVPLVGDDEDGNCTTCAVLAGDALISGVAPPGLAPTNSVNIDGEAAKRGQVVKLFDILPDHMLGAHEQTRAYQVWSWLTQRAQPGVYLFEQDEDHVYNFVVDGGFYLIDSNTQTYRKVNTPGDCSVASAAYPANFKAEKVRGVRPNTQYGFNYLNPPPDGDQDRLNVYRWGQLHARWK